MMRCKNFFIMGSFTDFTWDQRIIFIQQTRALEREGVVLRRIFQGVSTLLSRLAIWETQTQIQLRIGVGRCENPFCPRRRAAALFWLWKTKTKHNTNKDGFLNLVRATINSKAFKWIHLTHALICSFEWLSFRVFCFVLFCSFCCGIFSPVKVTTFLLWKKLGFNFSCVHRH